MKIARITFGGSSSRAQAAQIKASVTVAPDPEDPTVLVAESNDGRGHKHRWLVATEIDKIVALAQSIQALVDGYRGTNSEVHECVGILQSVAGV